MNKNIIVVYGTLRKNFHNHRLLKDAKFLGQFWTEPEFTMHSLGGFPAVVKGNRSILVEAYEVDEPTLKRIYQLEGYTGVRDAKNNWYNTTPVDTEWGVAEMFCFDKAPNAPIVKSGDWAVIEEYNHIF